MNTQCPYCQTELEKGALCGGKYPMKWYRKDAPFFENTLMFGGEPISGESRIEAYRCNNCGKIIVDTDSVKPYDHIKIK